jgi:hypothetical protein
MPLYACAACPQVPHVRTAGRKPGVGNKEDEVEKLNIKVRIATR